MLTKHARDRGIRRRTPGKARGRWDKVQGRQGTFQSYRGLAGGVAGDLGAGGADPYYVPRSFSRAPRISGPIPRGVPAGMRLIPCGHRLPRKIGRSPRRILRAASSSDGRRLPAVTPR